MFHLPNEKYSLVREDGWPCWYSTKLRFGTATSADVMQWCNKIFLDWLPQENTFANHFIMGNLSCIITDCVGDTEIRQGMPPGWALPAQASFACQASGLFTSLCHPHSHPSWPGPSSAKPHSHFVCAIAPVVHCCWYGHNQCRHAIADQIEVLPPGVFALENLHQHDVELHPLQEHPGESCQEEEVQEGSKDGTGNLRADWKEQGKVFVPCRINATVRITVTGRFNKNEGVLIFPSPKEGLFFHLENVRELL